MKCPRIHGRYVRKLSSSVFEARSLYMTSLKKDTKDNDPVKYMAEHFQKF